MCVWGALLAINAAAGAPWSPAALGQAFVSAGSPDFFDPDQLLVDAGRWRVAGELSESAGIAQPIKLFLVREADLAAAGGSVAAFAQQLAAAAYPAASDRAYLLTGLLVASTAQGDINVGPNIRYVYTPDFVTFALQRSLALLAQAQTEPAAAGMAEDMAQPYRFVDITWREIIIFCFASLLLLLCTAEAARLCGRKAAERRLQGTFRRYWQLRGEGWQLDDFATRACLACLRERLTVLSGSQTMPISLCELTCGHRFHADCIRSKRAGRVSCPLCAGAGPFGSLADYERALVELQARRERFWMSRAHVHRLFAHPDAPQISERAAAKPFPRVPAPAAMVPA